MKKYAAVFAIALVVATMCGAVVAQISATKPPNPKITLPGPQAHRPPGDRPAMTGTIFGFVYWDSTLTSHLPSPVCNALSITVAVASKGPYGPFGAMGTQSHFTPMATAHPPLISVNTTSYDGCAYEYQNAPLGQNLYVKLNLTQPLGTLTSATVMKNPAVGPIQFSNAPCSALPPLTKATVANLLGNWGSCQNVAYDVNLPLVIRQSLTVLSSSGGTGGNQGSQSGPLLNQTRPAGMLNNAAPQNTNSGSSPANGMLLPAVTPAPAQTPSTSQPGIAPGGSAQKVQLNPQPLPPRAQMTNADVIKMMSSSVPESVIISSIQSAIHKFDFSPASCRELQQAHITAKVLTAMGDGSVPQCTSTPPGPRAAATTDAEGCEKICTARCDQSTKVNEAQCHKTCHDRCTVTRTSPVSLPSPKSHGRVTNQRLAKQDEEIIAVLSQQKLVADRESADISNGLRSTAAAITSTRIQSPGTLQGISAVNSPGPGTAQDVQQGSHPQIMYAPHLNDIILTCTNDPTPRIVQVSGGRSHTLFTPDPKYNPYTIVGCGFGPARSGNSAYISAPSGFKANLNIDSWSDNGITAHLDPWLAGVLDQDNVTLVVAPSVGRGIQQSGFSFYAARGMPRVTDKVPQEVPLQFQSIPSALVTLSNVTFVQNGFDGLPSNATSKFPSFSYQGSPVAGWVFRYAYGHDDYGNFFNQNFNGENLSDYFCYINGSAQEEIYPGSSDPCTTFFDARRNTWENNLWSTPGADEWDVPLTEQFIISSYDVYYPNTDPSQICGAWDDSSKDSGQLGNWDFNLTAPHHITVNWTLYWCFDQEAWPFNRVNSTRQSSYGLAVWVWGPRCIDPTTGQPDPRCINTVKKIYGG